MDLRRTAEQEEMLSAFAALYNKKSTPGRVRASEPSGFDADLWADLVTLGVLRMGISERLGGWGATALDLALVAEMHGRFVAPAPFVEGVVAARFLRSSGTSIASGLLASVLSGSRLVTVAVRPARMILFRLFQPVLSPMRCSSSRATDC